MRLARVALRLAAALQFVAGGALAVEAILLIIREGPPRGPWTTLYLILLGLLAMLGTALARLAVAVWRRDRLAWALSLFLFVSIPVWLGALFAFGCPVLIAVLLVVGGPALLGRDP